MEKANDVVRAAFAWLVGLVAAGGALCAMGRFVRVSWIQPAWLYGHLARGRLLLDSAVVVAVSVGLVWIYATRFDSLLAGSAPVRGIKYGLITWTWALAVAVLVTALGLVSVDATRALYLGLGLLGVFGAFGLSVGVVYGAGRQYDEYYFGLGYGLPDRCSIA